MFAENGFFNEDVYMLIRRVRAKDENDEKEKIAHNNAKHRVAQEFQTFIALTAFFISI